ncbi:MAG: CdaR family protein [Chloroflexota bacterium]
MARPTIPMLPEFRRNGASRDQVSGFRYLLHTIALGRRPGEQTLSRQAILSRLLAAIVMSVALWYYVTDQENPIVRSRPFTLQPDIRNIPDGLAIRNQVNSVVITARGLQDQVSSPGQIIPVIDLKSVSRDAREATVPVTIIGGRSDVQYTVDPSTVSISLEPIVSKTVPVTFVSQSALPINLTYLTPSLSPPVLTISGPADQANRVDHATVSIPLSSITPQNPQVSSFTRTFNAIPQLFDNQGRVITASGLLPSGTRIKVTLQINVSLAIQTLAVAPLGSGIGLPLGYQLKGIQVEPPTVTVVGPPDAVNSLRAVSTLPINLSGVTKAMTLTTHLDLGSLPPDVAVYTQGKGTPGSASGVGPTWHVFVSVVKSTGSNALPAAVTISHLGKGLQATSETPSVQVYVNGPFVDIAKLGALTAVVKAKDLGPGVYQLKPSVALPPSLEKSYSVSPATITVTIKKKPTSKPGAVKLPEATHVPARAGLQPT